MTIPRLTAICGVMSFGTTPGRRHRRRPPHGVVGDPHLTGATARTARNRSQLPRISLLLALLVFAGNVAKAGQPSTKVDLAREPTLYVMAYTAGRAWIESLRTDHANHLLGLRLNDWTALIVFALALAYFLTHRSDSAPPEARRDVVPQTESDPA